MPPMLLLEAEEEGAVVVVVGVWDERGGMEGGYIECTHIKVCIFDNHTAQTYLMPISIRHTHIHRARIPESMGRAALVTAFVMHIQHTHEQTQREHTQHAHVQARTREGGQGGVGDGVRQLLLQGLLVARVRGVKLVDAEAL